MISEKAEQEVQACDTLFRKGQELIREVKDLERQYETCDEKNRAAVAQAQRDVQQALPQLESCQGQLEESRGRLQEVGVALTALLGQFQEGAQMVVTDRRRVDRLERTMLALESSSEGKMCLRSEDET